jgi:hypothetical protein
MANNELLLKVKERILADPESLDQDIWAWKDECGTKFCSAGHAINIALPDAEFLWFGGYFSYSFGESAGWVKIGELHRDIETLAQELLHLTSDEATQLFYNMQGLQDTIECIDAILNGTFEEYDRDRNPHHDEDDPHGG